MPRGELPETRRGRATSRDRHQRRIFVLDTNVLMHDPTAIFRFDEHDIYIPMIVLEELDAGKKGLSEAARNVRQVSRFLDELMASATKAAFSPGRSGMPNEMLDAPQQVLTPSSSRRRRTRVSRAAPA